MTTPSKYFPSQPPLVRTEPAGSSPALRIACSMCGVPVGEYCINAHKKQQTIAHKRRREEEVRTR
jgi:hypothetical protein